MTIPDDIIERVAIAMTGSEPGLIMREEIRQGLAALTPADLQSLLASHGMVVVPREPTEEMKGAAREISDCYPYKPQPNGERLGYLQVGLIWKALLAAAPRLDQEGK